MKTKSIHTIQEMLYNLGLKPSKRVVLRRWNKDAINKHISKVKFTKVYSSDLFYYSSWRQDVLNPERHLHQVFPGVSIEMFKHGGLNHFDWSSLEKRQGENLYPSHEDTFASISFFELSCLEQFVACVGRLLNSLWGLSSNHSQITGCGINALWKKDWLQNIQKRMPFIWDLWWERRQNKKNVTTEQ